MSYTASVNILTIISVERFIAIIYPLRSKQLATMCLLRLAVIMVWLVAGAAGTPYLIFYDTVDIPNTEPVMIFCLAKNINQKAYTTLNFLFGYVIPLAMMSVMYSCISNVLWKTSVPMNFDKSAGYAKKTYSTRTALNRPSKKKDRPKVGLQDEQYEMNEKASSSGMGSTMKNSAEEEQQKLVEKSNRRNNATRLLKRLDSSLSVDGETNENETESELEIDDRRLGGGSQGGNSRSLISALKSPATAKSPRMNGMKKKSSNHQHHQSKSASRPILQLTIKKPFISTTCKQENALLARRRVIRLLIVVIVSFASCVLPYHIRVLWQTWGQPNPSFWKILISPITFVIYYLNSGLNPLFYAFLSDRFRECLLEVITCRDYRVRRRMSYTNRTMHSIA
ncbi:hypothetical protein LSH36_671g01047 [Paralvinella palmiformis]|uniref:G-protein coupled receptors family 1 profile domain-containing protein n=1 Tax=Paralvinella palmiformis TaxID=53620 RepID=A0AAD9J3C3_9ANNE|nr:hypothetical protein LSH36_671g01047 [Paralvinella palmiformis]